MDCNKIYRSGAQSLNYHSIPARELEEPNRRCGKSYYRWSRGLSSSSSALPEGRHPANKKIHERCIGRFHEFFPVVWIAIQFRTDGSPDGVQPSLQNCFAKGRCGLNEARKWKIWQSRTRPPACDTMIERLTRDLHIYVEDGFRALLENIIEHTFDKVPWIN